MIKFYVAFFLKKYNIYYNTNRATSNIIKNGSDFQTLYEAADTALYDAKEGGRDRYAVYAEE